MHAPHSPPVRPAPGPIIVFTAKTTTLANVVHATTFLRTAGKAFCVLLFQAVPHNRLALSMAQSEQSPPFARLDEPRKSALLLARDDDDDSRPRPTDRPCATHTIRRASAATVRSTDDQPEQYLPAAQRLVSVATSSSIFDGWCDAARRSVPAHHTLCVQPLRGDVHLESMPTRTMQEQIRLHRTSATLSYYDAQLARVSLCGFCIEEQPGSSLTIQAPETTGAQGPAFSVQQIYREAIEAEIAALWAASA